MVSTNMKYKIIATDSLFSSLIDEFGNPSWINSIHLGSWMLGDSRHTYKFRNREDAFWAWLVLL